MPKRPARRCFCFSSRRRHTRFDCDWSSDVCSSDLDERPSHVMISNESKTEGKAAFGSIAHGGGHARVRYRNYDIGLGGGSPRELATQRTHAEVPRAGGSEAFAGGGKNRAGNDSSPRLGES